MLHHKMLLELNNDFPVQIKLNRGFPVQFQKRFMMQPRERVLFLSIQLFFFETAVIYTGVYQHCDNSLSADTKFPEVVTLGMEELKQKVNEIAEMLKPDLKDSMRIQMTPWKEAHKVRIEDLYTRLRIEKHTIKPYRTLKQELVDYKGKWFLIGLVVNGMTLS